MTCICSTILFLYIFCCSETERKRPINAEQGQAQGHLQLKVSKSRKQNTKFSNNLKTNETVFTIQQANSIYLIIIMASNKAKS
jgi:hypothetical protein